MNREDFESLKRGLQEVEAYAKGARAGFNTHTPVDVKAIRARTGKSQQAFAASFRLPVATVRDWEQNRRTPDAPARALLALISADWQAAERALRQAEQAPRQPLP